MNTIALRFADNIAPSCGTIGAHERVINQFGFVWYGKLGARVSKQAVEMIMSNEEPKILLINSGKTQRYWAHVEQVQYVEPCVDVIPSYYRDNREKFHTWFKVTKFELAEPDVMKNCIVLSSRQPLSLVSRASMSPYFKIEHTGKAGA